MTFSMQILGLYGIFFEDLALNFLLSLFNELLALFFELEGAQLLFVSNKCFLANLLL